MKNVKKSNDHRSDLDVMLDKSGKEPSPPLVKPMKGRLAGRNCGICKSATFIDDSNWLGGQICNFALSSLCQSIDPLWQNGGQLE